VEVNKILFGNLTRKTFSEIDKPKRRFSMRKSFTTKSKNLFEELTEAEENLKKKKLTFVESFKEIIPYLKIYSTFINNYSESSEILLRLNQNNPQYSKFMQKCRYANVKCRGQDLHILLINPIQRIPRYRLLLESLLKNSPNFHPEYHLLVDTLNSMKELAEELNFKRSVSESQKLTHKLIEKFPLFSLESKSEGEIKHQLGHRSYVNHGDLHYREIQKESLSDEKMNWIPVECFLYTDILLIGNIYSTQDDQSLFLKDSLYFHLILFQDFTPSEDENILRFKFNFKHFELKTSNNDSKKWIKNFQKCFDNERGNFMTKKLPKNKVDEMLEKKKKIKENFEKKLGELNEKLKNHSKNFGSFTEREKDVNQKLLKFLRQDQKFLEKHFKEKIDCELNFETIKGLKKKSPDLFPPKQTILKKLSSGEKNSKDSSPKRMSWAGSLDQINSPNLDNKTIEYLKEKDEKKRNSMYSSLAKLKILQFDSVKESQGSWGSSDDLLK
jgi:hypothetical protein